MLSFCRIYPRPWYKEGGCNSEDAEMEVWSLLSSQGLSLKTEVLCESSLAQVLLG